MRHPIASDPAVAATPITAPGPSKGLEEEAITRHGVREAELQLTMQL